MRVYVGPDATVKLHHDMEKGSGETFEDLAGGAPPPERELRPERERGPEAAPEEPPAAVDERAGRLKLSVQPEDASVYIDGAFRGSGREAGALRLVPGRHRIEIVRPGYRTAEQEVDVAPGEATPLSITLERPSN
jgi:PEGA domain